MKMKLEKGDPCFVRLHTGEVVEAPYHGKSCAYSKCHYVNHGKDLILCSRTPINQFMGRFQYPLAEMKRQMRLQ